MKSFYIIALSLILVLLYGCSSNSNNYNLSEVEQSGQPYSKDEVKINSLDQYIGENQKVVVENYGKPKRIDPSPYQYSLWVYPFENNGYVQFGILDEKVVTILAIGESLPTAPFHTGQESKEIEAIENFKESYQISILDNEYNFKLSKNDIMTQPLIQFNDTWLQLYIDTYTNTLSAIRYMDEETLVKLRPYQVTYRGELMSSPTIPEEKWREIEKSQAQQIFEITNVIRNHYGLKKLEWHPKTALVAINHSKDMYKNNFFSHISSTTGDLSERLKSESVYYKLAGENIAAEYLDGIAAVEGWLNSKSHRDTLLHEEFSHLGVGVFRKYYTQNFIVPWE